MARVTITTINNGLNNKESGVTVRVFEDAKILQSDDYAILPVIEVHQKGVTTYFNMAYIVSMEVEG